MFVVEMGTILSIVWTIVKAVNPSSTMASLGYLIALDVWLFLTVVFANFAEALAEARGKAQAEALRKTRRETPAYRIRNAESAIRNDEAFLEFALAHASIGTGRDGLHRTQAGRRRRRRGAGQIVPGDGEIIAGVASVDESAITGESAPVVREAGGDRSGVTGGTRVLSDRIVVARHGQPPATRSSTA